MPLLGAKSPEGRPNLAQSISPSASSAAAAAAFSRSVGSIAVSGSSSGRCAIAAARASSASSKSSMASNASARRVRAAAQHGSRCRTVSQSCSALFEYDWPRFSSRLSLCSRHAARLSSIAAFIGSRSHSPVAVAHATTPLL